MSESNEPVQFYRAKARLADVVQQATSQVIPLDFLPSGSTGGGGLAWDEQVKKFLLPLSTILLTLVAFGALIMVVMFVLWKTETTTLAVVTLLTAIIWGAYYHVLKWSADAAQMAGDTKSPTIATPAQTVMTTGQPFPLLTSTGTGGMTRTETMSSELPVFRYSVAGTSILFGMMTLTLILLEYGFLYKFLAFFVLTAFFPFSYLAYVAFQRNVRIERLRRDFDLLSIPWDERLYQQSQGFWNFALHIILAVVVTIAGLLIFVQPAEARVALSGWTVPLDPRTLEALRYGFIGAYLFSVQLIYRRYTTYDLQPSVYMYSALTILGGLAFNFAAFQAIAAISATGSQPTAGTGNLGDGAFAILAFALGFFPLLALQWMSRVAYNALGIRQRRAEDLALGLIDGVSQFHETRLRDHGIDNVQNLASADIPFLLINTTFSAQEVIDWIDQSILYLHLGASDIEVFRRGRIRTISDFHDMWSAYYRRPDDTHPVDANDPLEKVRQEKALQFQTTPYQLDLLYRATERGPNMNYVLNYWRNADADSFRLYNARYNAILEQALFCADNETEKLTALWQEAEKYRVGSGNRTHPTNSLARAGLGRLIMEEALKPDGRSSPEFANWLNKATSHYEGAIQDTVKLRKQAVEDLKFLTDAKMNDVVKKLAQVGITIEGLKSAPLPADSSKIPESEKQAVLNQQIVRLREAVEISRLFYGDDTYNISYLATLIELCITTDQKDTACKYLHIAAQTRAKATSASPNFTKAVEWLDLLAQKYAATFGQPYADDCAPPDTVPVPQPSTVKPEEKPKEPEPVPAADGASSQNANGVGNPT